jgi:hypothetical protein
VSESKFVMFEMLAGSITATEKRSTGEERALFSATPSLAEDGECLLIIDGRSFELWQASRLALEGLMFNF